MAVFRIERTRDYTVMSNHHLRDKALSLKSKGLLSMMLSLPEDWNYTTRGLAKICKEGVDAIGGALRELEAAGYIVRHQMRDRQGRISDTEYPGIRVTMTTLFDGVRTPLKIDISTGDAITPKEVRYSFKLMLEDRSIDVWAYNLETVLAEKLETIITRTTTNTRMRDFYDIAILQQLYGSTLDPHVLHDALLATAHKRGTERHLAEAAEVFDEVENSPVMQDLWAAYQKKFSYASDLGWDTVMAAVRQLFARCEGTV